MDLVGKLMMTLLFCCFLCGGAKAQNDAHYSATQFGLKGMLMSGVLVAGDDDGSMTYYNPAAIGYVRAKALDVSLLVPNFQVTQLKDAFGKATNDSEFDFQMIPNVLAFKLSLINNPRVGMGGVVLYKNNYENYLQFQSATPLGDQLLESDIHYRSRKREVWIGVGISYDLNDRFSIGLTQFITFRRSIYSYQFSQSIISESGSTAIIGLLDDQFNIDLKAHFGLLNKLGLSYKGNKADVGITLTTPTYGYPLRNGDYQYKSFLKMAEDEPLTGQAYTREKQKITLKTPYSIALGWTFKLKNHSTINFLTEYFGKINPYDIVYKNETADTFRVREAAKQVINVAMAWQIQLNDNFYYLGGFRTDFNYSRSVNNSSQRINTSTYNIYHVSNGFIFWLKNNKFTIGLDYGFSFDRIDQQTDVYSFNPQQMAIGNENSKVAYQSFGVLLTYGFLLDNIKKKASD